MQDSSSLLPLATHTETHEPLGDVRTACTRTTWPPWETQYLPPGSTTLMLRYVDFQMDGDFFVVNAPRVPILRSSSDPNLTSPPFLNPQTSSPSTSLNFDIAYEVVKHADVQDMARVACACKALYSLRDSDLLWWRPSCKVLGKSARLYVPHTEDGGPIHGGTWKEHFFYLWAARDRWTAPSSSVEESIKTRFKNLLQGGAVGEVDGADGIESNAAGDASSETTPAPPIILGGVQIEHGSVKVCVRMRPEGVALARSTRPNADKRVVLPLHQRLRIIKAQRGDDCTTGDAMRVLMEDSGRGVEASRSPWADAEVEDGMEDKFEESNVKHRKNHTSALKDVTNEASDAVLESTKKKVTQMSSQDYVTSGFEFTCGVLSVDETDNRVLAVAPGVGLREFAFDAVFGQSATQPSVYEKTGRPLACDFLNGLNGAMLVYGQTGSGKTHTMFGDTTSNETFGVVPRACREILDALTHRESNFGIAWKLTASYVEVYGQETFDLLNEGQLVGQSRVAARRYVLDGHTAVEVTCLDEITEILRVGDMQKRKAATAMNDRSSRAHCVFSLQLVQVLEEPIQKSSDQSNDIHTPSTLELSSRLCLVDLGGSEKLGKSRVNEGALAAGTSTWAEYYQSRRLMTEAMNINVGLLALKRVVDALHEVKRCKNEGLPMPHIPYCDSKLTEILSDALGGDGKTTVLVTAAPEHEHAIETVQSLRFGERCASVETRARVGQNALAGMLAALDLRIDDMNQRIKQSEKWVTTTTTRVDEHTGEEEKMVTSKLGGAESLRKELEAMLAERNFLAGRVATNAKE